MNPRSRSIVILFSAFLLVARGGLADPLDFNSTITSSNDSSLTNSSAINTTDSGTISDSGTSDSGTSDSGTISDSGYNDTVTAPSNETMDGTDGGDNSTDVFNNSDPSAPPSALVKASRLFTLKLELGPPLSSLSNPGQSGVRTVRAILNGTVTGRELNATILGGVAYPIAHSPNDTTPLLNVASASLWGLTSDDESFFITQTRLGPIDSERLGRLTVEFETGSRLSESLILSWPTKASNVSYTDDTDALLSFDAWGIV